MCVVVGLSLLWFMTAYVQQGLVTGRVTDDSGNGMSGVNVIRKGTPTMGTATNENGNFSIEAGEDDVLVISFIGYLTQEIRVGSQSNINVALAEDIATLNEVVVVGYGEMRRSDLTTAQTSIFSQNI